MQLTFDAICNMLISVTDETLLEQIEKDCTAVSDAMLSFPVMIPGTRYYRGLKVIKTEQFYFALFLCVFYVTKSFQSEKWLKQARARLMKTFTEMMDRRRKGLESHEDFLQKMLERDSYSSDEKMSDPEILDNFLTLIIAGQTTTAAAMMWSVKFLDDNRQIQHRLRVRFLSPFLS